MKTFKNEIAVIGPVSLRKAFIEELNLLGYRLGNDSDSWNITNCQNLILNMYGVSATYTHGNGVGNSTKTLTLPDAWGYALKLASETKIPEYVKLLPNYDSGRTGMIFKTKAPFPNFPDWNKDTNWESVLTKGTHAKYFIPSTKKEFDEQQKLKLIKVNSYDVVKVNEFTIKVGCKTFGNDEIYNLYNFLNNHDGVYVFNDVHWSSQNVKKLVGFIERK